MNDASTTTFHAPVATAANPLSTADEDAPVLFLHGISRTYSQGSAPLEILKNAELALWPGQSVALVAPSGAGKSTLLHVAGLLEHPDVGEVYVDKIPTSRLPDSERTRIRRTEIGFVYQFHHLLPEFSALENIVLPQLILGLSRREAEDRAKQLLHSLGLDERGDHRPAQLSGGEQQRVAIARAVANGPRLLLADEPTGNLDPHTAERVFEQLLSLVRQSGVAALIATHNLELAARMDRTLLLMDGILEDEQVATRSNRAASTNFP
jgi:lipoprotein-releasing system ATP-binding protein